MVWLLSLIAVEITQSIEVRGFVLAQSRKKTGARFQAKQGHNLSCR